jgi:hypothetical protein
MLKQISSLEVEINEITASIFWTWYNGDPLTKRSIENMYVSEAEYVKFWTTENGILESENRTMKQVREEVIKRLKHDIDTIITKCQEQIVKNNQLKINEIDDQYYTSKQYYLDTIQRAKDAITSTDDDNHDSNHDSGHHSHDSHDSHDSDHSHDSKFYHDLWQSIFEIQGQLSDHYWRLSRNQYK